MKAMEYLVGIGLVLISLLLIGCNTSNEQKYLAFFDNNNVKNLSYDVQFATEKGRELKVRCMALPNLLTGKMNEDNFALNNLEKTIKSPSSNFMVDSVYQYQSDNCFIQFINSLEVGFLKHYKYEIMMDCKDPQIIFSNNVSIGNHVSKLANITRIEFLNGASNDKKVDFSRFDTIEYSDWWGIYTHEYKIEDGTIKSIKVSF